MELRRVRDLPPYVFATVDELKRRLRREGRDVIDLGFGNPDIPSPPVAVEKLVEAATRPANHRYSASRGIPNLRAAVCELYERRFGVQLDPERQVVSTIGAKEGLAHLMWVLVEPGDVAVVPTPSYPIHLVAPRLAVAELYERRFGVRVDPETQVVTTIGAKEGLAHLMWVLVEPGDVAVVPTPSYPIHLVAPRLAGATVVGSHIDAIEDAVNATVPAPRVVVVSFPHNPTTSTATPELMQRLVDLARERDFVLVHDFAYADIAFDGHEPPSVLAADGADECAVELYSLTKSFSMAGWRVGFVVGRADVVQALAKLKSYLDYGTFQPIQIASIVALRDEADYPREVCEIYRSRRDALCGGLARAGWDVEPPRGTMFVWAPIPEPFAEEGSLEFALRLANEASVAVSPGVGFGEGGEGYVRFALVENEQRIAQATRSIRKLLAAPVASTR